MAQAHDWMLSSNTHGGLGQSLSPEQASSGVVQCEENRPGSQMSAAKPQISPGQSASVMQVAGMHSV
ncbi:hypothetical protein [Nannocystis pusilla]|uniref:hypothetical protein n=1 Tax=Nannocystis pusilla TaxID=889268 RepID=UPI003B76BE37